MGFDIKTILVVSLLLNIISSIAIAAVWRNSRKRFLGINFWVTNTIFQSIGSLFIVLRGILPDFISIVLSNFLLMLGAIMLLTGLKKFIGNKSKEIHNYIMLALFTLVYIYFGSVNSNLFARTVTLSVLFTIISAQSCFILFTKSNKKYRDFILPTGIILGGYIIVSITRVLLMLFFPTNQSDFFKTGVIDFLSVILYLCLSAGLTVSLILMVNKRLLREVKIQEEKYTKAFHSAPFAITLIRLSDGIIIEVNDGFESMTGYDSIETTGKTSIDLELWVEDDDRIAFLTALNNDEIVQNREILFRKKSREIFTGLFSSSKVNINNEDCAISIIGDISELSEMKKKLESLASHDVLTGLPNRILFQERFDLTLAYAKRKNKSFAMLSLDLDKLKNINDTHGHDVGDKTLIELAKRLNNVLRKSDTVARFGGDEFMILLSDIASREDSDIVITKILEQINRPLIIDELVVNITVSLGVSIYPQDGEDMNELSKKSDKALYYVKEHGRANYKFYSEL